MTEERGERTEIATEIYFLLLWLRTAHIDIIIKKSKWKVSLIFITVLDQNFCFLNVAQLFFSCAIKWALKLQQICEHILEKSSHTS